MSDSRKPDAISAEQEARDMLERIGVENAQSFTSGDLVELANLIAANSQRGRYDRILARGFGVSRSPALTTRGYMAETTVLKWVPAIPLAAFTSFRFHCLCGRAFWTEEGYRGHYALAHILLAPARSTAEGNDRE